jgi:hypothetical protein
MTTTFFNLSRLALPAALRAVCLALVVLIFAMFVAGVAVRGRELSVVCLDTETTCQDSPPRPTPAQAAALAASGLTLPAFAALEVGKLVVFYSLWFALGAFIFARRGREPMGLLTAFFLMTFMHGVDGTRDALVRAYPLLELPELLLGTLVSTSYPLFLALFPNGQWVPRWTRWVMLAAIVLGLAQQFILNPISRNHVLLNMLSTASQLGLLGLLLAGQVIRYRRYSTATERLQTRWVVTGMAASLVLLAGLIVIVLALKIPRLSLAYFYGELVYQTAIGLIPLSIGVSILRYRLWDIDVIVRRTLIYSVLTAVLGLAYLSSVLVLESVFRALTGQGQNSLVVVLSTLAIAALFIPLRARVQRLIDRRFYRRKYDAARTLALFSSQARDVVELEQLESQLVRVVDETMQPAHVDLWLRPASTPTPPAPSR